MYTTRQNYAVLKYNCIASLNALNSLEMDYINNLREINETLKHASRDEKIKLLNEFFDTPLGEVFLTIHGYELLPPAEMEMRKRIWGGFL